MSSGGVRIALTPKGLRGCRPNNVYSLSSCSFRHLYPQMPVAFTDLQEQAVTEYHHLMSSLEITELVIRKALGAARSPLIVAFPVGCFMIKAPWL